jgi:hypothetical protein
MKWVLEAPERYASPKGWEKSARPLFGEDHEDPKQRENGCGHDCEQVLHSLAFFTYQCQGAALVAAADSVAWRFQMPGSAL